MRIRPLFVLGLSAATLSLAACGDDDESTPQTTAIVATTANTATTASTATVTTATIARGGYVSDVDPEADAVAQAWTTAFDSTTGFTAKADYIAEAEALRSTIDSYTAAGDAVGGIELAPTDVSIAGDAATVTYDVLFAGQPAYRDQTGTIERVDGAWIVSREQFCGFMAAARNPCP